VLNRLQLDEQIGTRTVIDNFSVLRDGEPVLGFHRQAVPREFEREESFIHGLLMPRAHAAMQRVRSVDNNRCHLVFGYAFIAPVAGQRMVINRTSISSSTAPPRSVRYGAALSEVTD
jgi:hypothetical protein